MTNYLSSERGYIALITVSIIMAVVLLIVISASQLSISESEMALKQSRSAESFYLASACAEIALEKLKNNLNYGGNENIAINNNQCVILPIEGTGNKNRIIKTESRLNDQYRKIVVKLAQINPQTVILSWQEVANF